MRGNPHSYPGINPHEPELVQTLKKIRYDLTDLQVKVSEALRMAATANLPDTVAFDCECGCQFKSAVKLAEHRYHSHDGPLPDHYAQAEARAGESAA